jgi:hypothetical protein
MQKPGWFRGNMMSVESEGLVVKRKRCNGERISAILTQAGLDTPVPGLRRHMGFRNSVSTVAINGTAGRAAAESLAV